MAIYCYKSYMSGLWLSEQVQYIPIEIQYISDTVRTVRFDIPSCDDTMFLNKKLFPKALEESCY